MRLHITSLPIVLLLIATGSIAQEAPRLGLLYNTSERHSLTYSCTQQGGASLACEFVQTSVRPKATFAELPSAIEKGRQEFSKSSPPDTQDCKLNRTLLNILEGREKVPKEDALEKLNAVQRRDMVSQTQAVLKLCESNTEANFLELIRFIQDKNRRTCRVSSSSFKQSFRQAPESPPGVSIWLADSRPEGPCGVVQLSRFESEQTKIGSSVFTNWKFVARKAITNPGAELFPGASCRGFDEQPYVYDWRTREHALTCDYIEFTPL